MRQRIDERVVRMGQHHAFGYLGPISSSFTLAWLASHRGRIRSLLLGGKRLSILVTWDSGGGRKVADRTPAEEDAIRTLTFGAPASTREDAP